MTFTSIWKLTAGLPLTHVLLLMLLLACSIVGACIALYVAIPLALAFFNEKWHTYSRRKARWQRYVANTKTDDVPYRRNRGAGGSLAYGQLHRSLKPRFAVLGRSALVLLGGVALGYMLTRPPEVASRTAKITESSHESARLRLDYDLRQLSR
jgi:hypothetical protein